MVVLGDMIVVGIVMPVDVRQLVAVVRTMRVAMGIIMPGDLVRQMGWWWGVVNYPCKANKG